jgi:hypothetical protein
LGPFITGAMAFRASMQRVTSNTLSFSNLCEGELSTLESLLIELKAGD